MKPSGSETKLKGDGEQNRYVSSSAPLRPREENSTGDNAPRQTRENYSDMSSDELIWFKHRGMRAAAPALDRKSDES